MTTTGTAQRNAVICFEHPTIRLGYREAPLGRRFSGTFKQVIRDECSQQPTFAPRHQPPTSTCHHLRYNCFPAWEYRRDNYFRRQHPQALQQALGDQGNRHNLAQALYTVAQGLPKNADEQAVLAALKNQQMDIHPASSYPQETPQASRRSVSLEAFITQSRLALPKTQNHCVYLADAVAQKALQHPLGNFGGGLSWPIPLSVEDQSKVGTLVDKNTADLPGLPLQDIRKGTLGYLLSSTPCPLLNCKILPKRWRNLLPPRSTSVGPSHPDSTERHPHRQQRH